MKIDCTETDEWLFINLTPENMLELSKLMRYAQNPKAEPPSVHLSFNNPKEHPVCYISLRKLKTKNQKNYIKKI